MNYLKLIVLVVVLCWFSLQSFAQEADQPPQPVPEKVWGIGAVMRSGSIPFKGDAKRSTSFVPLLYYQGDHFYLDGVDGGFHLYRSEKLELNVLARLRFFDADNKRQNQMQGDTLDWGGQVRYRLNDKSWLDTELLTDPDGRLHGNLRYAAQLDQGDLEINPYVNLRIKSSEFNNRYYALSSEGYDRIGGSADLQIGSRFRYHVASNFYLLAGIEAGLLDHEVRNAEAVDARVVGSAFAGFGFFNDKRVPRRPALGIRPWIRLAQGIVTPSSIGKILSGTIDEDPYDNRLTSIFFGIPLTDELFGLPLEIYLTPGYAYHHSSSVQSAGSEIILAVKAYYRFHWPIQMRLGLGSGMSWVSKITYQERTNNEGKGFLPHALLHYLDFTFDLNLGDLTRNDSLSRLWLGVGVHHRSAIFESAQQYGRIKGGSNYPMLYLQMDF